MTIVTSRKQVTNFLYIAVFSRKNEIFGEIKVDIEYHRLCLWETCNGDLCVGQWYCCRSCRVS